MKLIRMMKYALAAFITVMCEQTFGKYIAISGAVPMLTLCFCTAFSMLENDVKHTAVMGAVCGAVCDVLSGHGFGTYTVTFLLSSYATFMIHDKLFSSKWLFLSCDIFVLTIFSQVLYYLFHAGELGMSGFFAGFVSIILPMAIYNIAAAVIIYFALSKALFGRR